MRSADHQGQSVVGIETLEGRVLLSAAPVLRDVAGDGAKPQAVAEPLAKRRAGAGPTLSLADRQELLNNWIGPNKATLQTLLNANDAAGFDAELLDYMRTRTNRRYFFDVGDEQEIVDFINSDAGLVSQKNNRLAKADDALAHRFPGFVNSTSYDVQYPAGAIDWLAQPSTTVTTNSDFRNVLNRHIHWIDLAMVFRFTGDAKYATELKTELDSWSRQYTRLANPDTWADDAVRPKWDLFVTSQRTDNWLYAYHLVLGSDAAWNGYYNTMFLHRLFVQADFMRRTTVLHELTNNKATGHATALYNIAMLFPEFKNAADWETYAQNRMFQALTAQFREDGLHYEQSPGYHGGAMSGFFDAYRLAALNGKPWGSKPTARLRTAIQAFYQMLAPDGTQSALSDTYRSNGMSFFTKAALAFNTTVWPKGRPRIDDCWQFGAAACTPLLGNPTTAVPSSRGGTAFFGTSGYYVTRTGDDVDARQLTFDAGPKGGQHGHYDLLNFELYGYGKPLIADPGLMSYSSSYATQRAQVISTPAHNTISIDGKNHAASEKATVAKLTQWTRKTGVVQMAATHYAYQGLAGSPVVARNIYHNRGDVFLVVDFGKASASHTFQQSFNLAMTSYVKLAGGAVRTTTGTGDVLLQPLLRPGQTTATKGTVLSYTAPPSGTVSGTRFSVSQTTSYAIFATLMVTFDNGAVPDVSARWLRLPSAARAGQIEVTRDGVATIVYFALPDLSPVSGAAAPKSLASAVRASFHTDVPNAHGARQLFDKGPDLLET